jgi:uncharacterized protein (DUF488 family)
VRFQRPTIFTIGHGLAPISTLLDTLLLVSVDKVVDVRSVPGSQRAPQYNRRDLESVLRARGVDYEWAGETLGGRPPAHLRTRSGAPDYERMVGERETADALDALVAASRTQRIALLCSETRPEECHRSRMLEPEIERRGADVEHLLPDGSRQSAPTLFA